jgi:PAS domain S-box-containing protein
MEAITILIVWDHTLLRQAWSFLLSKDPVFRVVAQCDNHDDAIQSAKELLPDMVIMDINIPGIRGPQTILQIRNLSPDSIILPGNHKEIFHFLFELATEAIIMTDDNGICIETSEHFCAMFGFNTGELLQTDIKELFDQEQLQVLPTRYNKLAIGEDMFIERKMVRKDGTAIYIEAYAKRFVDNNILAIVNDISGQLTVQKTLQKSESHLHSIFETANSIYILVDTHLRIITFNSKAIDFVKKELDRTIEVGGYYPDYFPATSRPGLLNQIKEVFSGKQLSYEVSYPQSDGSYKWYFVRMLPSLKGDKIEPGLMMEVTDISERKILERELVNQKVREQKNTTRAVLRAQEIERNRIGQELHDNVNQLMATVKLYITMIRESSTRRDITERAIELLDIAIGEIRVISKDQVTPDNKFSLKELIEDLVQDLNENTQAKTKFESHVASPLTIDEDLKINIYRIVQEQVNNILKYASASTARVSILDTGRVINISIVDDGKGFDPGIRRKGIGLSNMCNRVEANNGKISLESSPGNGCSINIVIPY